MATVDTDASYPFQSSFMNEDEWRTFFGAAIGDGVVSGFDVTPTAPETNAVDVSAGKAFVNGCYAETTASKDLAFDPPDATNGRYDLVVLRLDAAADKIELATLTGTPGPVGFLPPLLTQGQAVWEMTVARVLVSAAPSVVSVGEINQVRFKPAAGRQAQVPPGSIQGYAGATEPPGWVFCNGQTMSRVFNADLFAAIGTTHGTGDGSATFNVPDYRGRTLLGLDNMGGAAAGVAGDPNASVLGGTGGLDKVTLSESQIPSHDHTAGSLAAGSNGLHDHDVPNALRIGSGGDVPDGPGLLDALTAGQTTAQDGSHGHPITGASGNAGGGQEHENMPPYRSCNVIIKL